MALLGSAVVFILFDRAPGTLEDFYAWHDREHMPERLGVPGFLRGRRYHVVGIGPQFLTLYEARDLEVLVGPDYLQRLNNPTPLSRKVGPLARNNARGVCRVVRSISEPASGSALALIQFACANTFDMNQCLSAKEPEFRVINGLYGVHWCETNNAASRIEVEEKKNREIFIPKSLMLIEGNNVANVLAVAHSIVEASLAESSQPMRDVQITAYSLEVTHLPAGSNTDLNPLNDPTDYPSQH